MNFLPIKILKTYFKTIGTLNHIPILPRKSFTIYILLLINFQKNYPNQINIRTMIINQKTCKVAKFHLKKTPNSQNKDPHPFSSKTQSLKKLFINPKSHNH